VTAADWVLDGLLACSLPILAWLVLATTHLPKAVVLFIAFGLLSALAWARLGAPDVALVEAAVGAGLTGALLMSAFEWLRPLQQSSRASLPYQKVLSALLLVGLSVGLSVGLGAVVLALPEQTAGLSHEVLAEIDLSGAAHPVTAVLLNFRGYDTLLEIAVLLVAALAVQLQVRRGRWRRDVDREGPLLPALVRLLMPGLVLVSGYLLWRGSHAPGGAFQAGVVLGGGGILLILSGTLRPPSISSLWVRALLVFGPAFFLAVATAPLFGGEAVLEYPPQWAGLLILCIESALTLSIALSLMLFFPASARVRGASSVPPQREQA
jgi:multisubunit Na+/H+ antiporter MnhB subunit